MDKSMEGLRELPAVAAGRREAELYIEGGSLVNVYTGEIYPANVAVFQGKIAYVGESRKMVGSRTEVINAGGYYLCPGFIEAHSHLWMACNTVKTLEAALPLGNTAFACDNLFFFVYLGAEGFIRLMDALDHLPVNLYWLARIAHQAQDPCEQEYFSMENLDRVFAHPRVLKVGEITRWPLLAEGDESLLAKISLARRHNLGIEGHTAGCSYDRLNAVAATGVESCHEAITAEELIQRLRLGLWTILRNSSLRPDLPELLRAVRDRKVQTGRLLFTTDGSTPAFLKREGFLDGMLRMAVAEGIDPVNALQMATINPAVYLGLEREIGGIAPGRQADILLLPDLRNFIPHLVVARGRVAALEGKICSPLPEPDWTSLGLRTQLPPLELVADPALYGVPAEEAASFPVIEMISGAITRLREVTLKPRDGFLERREDLLYCSLIDRGGGWSTNGFLAGAGKWEALAANFTTSFDLLVMGRDRAAMARAAAELVEMGGGVVLMEGGETVFRMRLEYGMMGAGSFAETASKVEELEKRVGDLGYPFHDILYTLLFLVCDFLPGPRITAGGIYDVKSRRVLVPSRPITKK